MIVVPAEGRHIAQIMQIENKSFTIPWPSGVFYSVINDPRACFLVAVESDDTVLGYVVMKTILDEGYIDKIAVIPQIRRQGVANALMEVLGDTAADLELAFMTLEVRESNAAAIGLYSKHGFEEVGRRPSYYDKPKEDAVLMTRYLRSV